MQTQSDTRPTSSLSNVATVMRWMGWGSFWVQLTLGILTGISLLFVFSGRNFSRETTAGIGISLFWAICGLAALVFGLYQAFRYTRLAKRLRHPNTAVHPKKSDTIQIVRWSIVVGIVGMLFGILGAGSAVGTLLSKAIAQPQGVAIYDPTRIIRALDIFGAVANVNVLTAHFVGMVVSLWLFSWLHRQ